MIKLIPLFLLCVFMNLIGNAQFTQKIKADSVLITNDSCSAELIVENSTKFVKGFLYNRGNGRTEFRRAFIQLTDSTYLFGNDTLNFRSLLNTIGYSSVNIYNSNGTLTSNRFVNIDSSTLSFGKNTSRYLHLFNTGNLWLGASSSPVDAGYKLELNGNTKMSGQLSVFGAPGFIAGVTQSDFVPSFYSNLPATFQVNQQGSNWGLAITRSDNNLSGPHLTFFKTYGSNVASVKGALPNGASLGNINFGGITADGTSAFLGAGISAYGYGPGNVSYFSNWASGTVPPTNTLPASIQFNVTDFDGVKRRVLDILPRGQVVITRTGFLNWSTDYALQVDGNTSLHGVAAVGNSIGTAANSSAQLEVISTTKGFLPPRMTGSQAEAISSPAEGLMIYATNGNGTVITSKGWWGFNGTTWEKLNN